MSSGIRTRILRVALAAALFLVCGLLYAAVVSWLGGGIPCVFRLITGFRCPGCGITHSMLCLLHLDFVGAVRENAMIFPMLIFVLWVLFYSCIRYIRTGKFRLDSGSAVADITAVVLLLVWWVLRNIIGI